MERCWWRAALAGQKKLVIDNPGTWASLPNKVEYGFNPYGYREYDEVVVHNICEMWLSDMTNFLGVINSAMTYPSIIYIRLLPKIDEYKTYPDFEKLGSWLYGKGFSDVRRDGQWLIGEKK